MRRMKEFLVIAVSAILEVSLTACSDSTDNPVNPNPQPADGIPPVVKNLPGYEAWDSPVDYNKAENWAALPTKAVLSSWQVTRRVLPSPRLCWQAILRSIPTT